MHRLHLANLQDRQFCLTGTNSIIESLKKPPLLRPGAIHALAQPES